MSETNNLSDKELLEIIHKGDNKEEATNELILRYKSLVEVVAMKYINSPLEKDDLVQEGMIGLLAAINSFNCNKGASLNTYACKCISNSIQTALLSKAYSTIPSTGTTWYFALLYILVSADSRYITGLAPALVPLDSNDELLMVWARSYILSGGLSQYYLLLF